MVENKSKHIENNSEGIQVGDVALLPFNCVPLKHQVSGHFFGKGKTKLVTDVEGILQTSDGFVLKPLQTKSQGEREHNFFKRMFLSDESQLNQDELNLKKFLPVYRGSFVHNDNVYIKMDDIAYGIQYPAIIDFKIGRYSYDPDASVEKIIRQKQKYPLLEKVGFQLNGMRVYNQIDKSFAHYDSIFGRDFKEEDLIHGLALFYQFPDHPQLSAIRETLRKFEEIHQWFEKQSTYHFYSSSVIVAYEANLEDMQNKELSESDSVTEIMRSHFIANRVRLAIADFSHIFPAQNKLDENCLFGIEGIINLLRSLLNTDYVVKDVRKKVPI